MCCWYVRRLQWVAVGSARHGPQHACWMQPFYWVFCLFFYAALTQPANHLSAASSRSAACACCCIVPPLSGAQMPHAHRARGCRRMLSIYSVPMQLDYSDMHCHGVVVTGSGCGVPGVVTWRVHQPETYTIALSIAAQSGTNLHGICCGCFRHA